jgi:ADP-ribose pyrophosphatase YjhB (NUDIX family)
LAQPELVEAVADAVAEHTAGSPVDPDLLWTNRSPRQIAEELTSEGFAVCADTVRKIVTEELGLRVRQAIKDEATRDFPDRDPQFRHIAELRKSYHRRGWPVLSIDTKKKELLGDFFRPGTAYTDGEVRVLDHDFATQGDGRLVPYGVYDTLRNEGLMYLSIGPDTSELACDAVWRWWQRLGHWHYGSARGLLLLCDCGGSNGNRQHLFKEQLHYLAGDLDLPIRVAHYPPGCSKYNPIERRLFSQITRTLQSVVLRTIEIAKRFMTQTATATGLRVIAEIARRTYTKGHKTSADFVKHMPIRFHYFLPELNYTVYP